MKALIISFLCLLQIGVFAQNEDMEKIRKQILSKTDTVALKIFSLEIESKYRINRAEALEWAKRNGYLIKGKGIELQGIKDGKPIYYITYNRVAAQTVSTDKVQVGGSSGLNLDGSNIHLGIWDEGAVYDVHTSFREGLYGPRHAYFIDSTGSEINDHATHVAGTMIADNDVYNSKGMADKSTLYSRDWNWDIVEMTNAALGLDINIPVPLILSNHSYGRIAGWHWGDLRNVR